MGLFDWIKRLRRREDEAALNRAKAEKLESPAERRFAEDYEGRQADEEVGLIERDQPGEAERLAEE